MSKYEARKKEIPIHGREGIVKLGALLDGTASEEDIKALLDLSCSLTRSRKRKARKTENKGMEDDQ